MNTQEQLKAEIARLQAENVALKARPEAKAQKLTLKVSKSGAISIYGLGRFPVTLYKEQWLKVLDIGKDITAFLNMPEAQFMALQQEAITKAALADKK